MRIKLIPLYPDPKKQYPYLSLMKLSAWHKQQGDVVGFNTKDPDKIYIVTPFRKAARYYQFSERIQVEYGGYGFNNKQLPEEIEHTKPDYSLYSVDYSMGFTTRGCVRRCTQPPCIVPECEGTIRKNSPVEEFYEGKFKKIRLLDNNILALKDWFFKNTDFIIDNDLRLTADQGFDIRLVDNEIAKRISNLNFERFIYFALDSLSYLEQAKKGVEKLEAAGVKPYRMMFYCYGKDNLIDVQARVKAILDMGAEPFIMPDAMRATRTIRRYARYINRRIYKTTDWEHYYG